MNGTRSKKVTNLWRFSKISCSGIHFFLQCIVFEQWPFKDFEWFQKKIQAFQWLCMAECLCSRVLGPTEWRRLKKSLKFSLSMMIPATNHAQKQIFFPELKRGPQTLISVFFKAFLVWSWKFFAYIMYDFEYIALVWCPRCEAETTQTIQLSHSPLLGALANHHLASEISWANKESDRQTHTHIHTHRDTDTHTITFTQTQTCTQTHNKVNETRWKDLKNRHLWHTLT